jgi:hypothetical protein
MYVLLPGVQYSSAICKAKFAEVVCWPLSMRLSRAGVAGFRVALVVVLLLSDEVGGVCGVS